MSLMNCLDVLLQMSWFSEGFSTWITIVISFSTLECLDVPIQMSWLSEGFYKNITLIMSMSFMNCLDVLLQISWFSEGFSIRIAFVIPLSFMNCLDVLTQISDWFLYELLIHEFDKKFCYIYCIQKFWLSHEQFLCVCLWIDWLKISFRNFRIWIF